MPTSHRGRAESWRDLRAGDRIRLVRMPSEFGRPGYQLHRSTRRVYERLIERRRPLRVYEVDEWGLPWIACRFRQQDGSWAYHFLAFNHDGWVRVKSRTRPNLRPQNTKPRSGGGRR
jgi:hypothetical protein